MTTTPSTITTALDNPINNQVQAAQGDTPVNAVTGKSYFGDKAKRLQAEADYRGYPIHTWATMKQWNSIRETIAKGEKGTLMVHLEKQPDGTEQQKRSFLFNRCQLESYLATDCGDKAC